MNTILLANKNRKRQIKLFIDIDRPIMNYFYEIIERNLPNKKLIQEMRKLIEIDKDFYDPYLVLAKTLFFEKRAKEEKAILREAYERAVMRIADCKGRWPQKMYWGFLENRHIMRALEQYAILCWEIGNIDEALDIFRRLLHINPNDNQGVRYNILIIRMGVGIEEWEKPFKVKDKGGKVMGLDGRKVHTWFEKNSKKFLDEFEWWFKEMEETEE